MPLHIISHTFLRSAKAAFPEKPRDPLLSTTFPRFQTLDTTFTNNCRNNVVYKIFRNFYNNHKKAKFYR